VDADLNFYSDVKPIYDELGDDSILIVEHRYAPEHEHLAPKSGIYNVGTMAFRNDEKGLVCLRWWRERCLEWCYNRFEDGKFGDQKYLDDWPERFDGVVVLQHKGAGLAPWNVARYKLELNSRPITVDGQTLIFYHFHDYKPISRRLAIPAGGYSISPKQALYLYLPYARALQKVETMVSQPLNPTVIKSDLGSTRDIIKSLQQQRLLLVRPWLLSLILLYWEDWRSENKAKIEAGFGAYAEGDLMTARHYFLSAIRRNPLVLRNLGIVSILLETQVGSIRMKHYRYWWQRIRMKTQRQ
jgi:hypothetical protein